MTKLLAYDYEIQYRLGRENLAAVDNPILHHLSCLQVTLWEDIKKAMHMNNIILFKKASATTNPLEPYNGRHWLLFFKGRLIVPNDPELRKRILQEMDDIKIVGHSRVLCMFKRLQQQFYWPHMHHSVQQYVQTYSIYQ